MKTYQTITKNVAIGAIYAIGFMVILLQLRSLAV